jgi:leader peptidase (prepilin peptidase)/N-methyltransferase
VLPALLAATVGLAAGALAPYLARRFGAGGAPPGPARIGWAATGAAAGAAVGWRLDPPALLAWLAVLAVAAPLAAIDLACLRLPDALVAPAGGAVALVAAAAGDWPALAAGALAFAAFAALALLPRSALGFGDVKLAGVLGIALGLLGWGALVRGAALSVGAAGIVALGLLACGRARRDTPVPFGPFLLAGALLAAVTAG